MGRYDHAYRKKATRAGRQRGCFLYIPAEQLMAVGFDVSGPLSDLPPVYYRVWTAPDRPRLVVNLYREP